MGNDQKYQRLLKRVAANIKAARESKNLTQEEMVEFGFNYRHYQRIESGKHSFNLHTLSRLSDIFRVDIRVFFQ